MSAVLDTHTVLWYLEFSKELSITARTTIEDAIREGRAIRISAISVIERKRILPAALERLRQSLMDPSAGLTIAPVDAFVADTLENVPRSLVPDMPDRIIAATALHLNLPIVTRDRRLQSAGIQTIW
jgi:PIN domain nuclease of toxin-antitoxin system